MRKIFSNFFTIAILCLGIFFTSSCDKCKDKDCQNGATCEKGKCICPAGFTGDNCELCNGKTCQNGGTCVSGTCNCPSGYYGDDCSISCTTCATFSGNYKTNFQFCNTTAIYSCSISISTTASNKIILNNFINKGWAVIGDVSGNSFTIAAQNFTDGSTGKNWKVESTAAATFSGVNLLIPVKFTDVATSNTVNCTGFGMQKQ